jgi:peptide/nickel transport system permease protein
MSTDPLLQPTIPPSKNTSGAARTIARVAKFAAVKALTLFLTVVAGLYLAILIFNLGGRVDDIFRSNIDESISAMIRGGWIQDITDEAERMKIIDETRVAMEEAMGLNESFFLRSLRWLWQGLRLDLGKASASHWFSTQNDEVRNIIRDRVPFTLVLIGLSNLLVFVISIVLALALSRQHGSFWDRFFVVLSPLTSAPSWIIGIILIALLAGELHLLPYPRVIEAAPTQVNFRYFSIMFQQMLMPMLAIFIAAFFSSVYAWRTFFLIFSDEDYVQVARAKGLKNSTIDRRYILRPILPYVLTSFATMMIMLWQGSIALELLFYWPGIGALFIDSVKRMNTPISLGVVVVFAYLLAATVFILDVIYALVDPRVRVGGDVEALHAVRRRRRHGRQPGEKNLHTTLTEKHEFKAERQPFSLLVTSRRFRDRFAQRLQNTGRFLRELLHYPSAMIGISLIFLMVILGVYIMVKVPYGDVVALWRGSEGDMYRSTWYKNPDNAQPTWVNWFRKEKLPKTVILHESDPGVLKSKRIASEKMNEITIQFPFIYDSSQLPQNLVLYFDSTYEEKKPLITLTWQTADGRELDLGNLSVESHESYYLTQDERLKRKLKNDSVLAALFDDPDQPGIAAEEGSYLLTVQAFTFEPEADVSAEMLLYGKVFGLAGTDNKRRDLAVGLLWGIPVALVFGVLGAIGTSTISLLIAAVGVWFGGWVDDLVQRLTELNMILPMFPIVILVSFFYTKSIWVLLGVIVLLSVFGSAIKNYRSVLLQIKSQSYIEAARAQGAGDWRIIRHYLAPPLLPVLIPQLVILVPVFVFYEATFAYLGISDPYVPTWGKIIYEALAEGTLDKYPYWFLEPVGLLILTAIAFAFLGFALERVLNPRLRRN